ncbi:MAG: DnaJ domain-containing protein [Herminiimonas sp.]|nr:DnaJ domain-containing protein [Herminiimonas sp.]
MKDHYAILGVERDATSDAIKTAYRKMAAAYHPDRNAAPDAPAKFREAQEAYEILAEPPRRLAYDESRRRSLVDNPLDTAVQLWTTYLQKVLR